MEEKRNKKGIVAAVILIAAVVLAGAAYLIFKPAGTPGDKTITVEVVLEDKSSKEHQIKTEAEFLRQALEQENLVAGDESDFGLFVTEVDGVAADSGRQQWWRFTKDGEQLDTGVDTTPIADGDHFEVTLTTGW